MLSHSVTSNSVTPWTVAQQGPLSTKFSRQIYVTLSKITLETMQYLIQMEEDVILYILRVQCHLSLLKKPKRMVRRVDLSSNSLGKTYPNKDMGDKMRK